MKLKKIFLNTIVLAGGLLVSSCNDFLDMKPLDQVTPGEYFGTADQVGA